MNLSLGTTYSNNPLTSTKSFIEQEIDFILAARGATRSPAFPNTLNQLSNAVTIASTRLAQEEKTLEEEAIKRPEHKPQIMAMIEKGRAKLQELQKAFQEESQNAKERIQKSITLQVEIDTSNYNALANGMSLASASYLLPSFQNQLPPINV